MEIMSKHITGHTGLLCLLGSPVAHSVSPEMHNEACDQLGLDYTYLAFDVPEEKMPEAVQGLRTMGARGWNITMPGKNIMCKLADKVSPASEISGACNTIVNDNGVLTAYTTDGVGFMRAVAENGVDIIGKKMTLLGAGGAATAILVKAARGTLADRSRLPFSSPFITPMAARTWSASPSPAVVPAANAEGISSDTHRAAVHSSAVSRFFMSLLLLYRFAGTAVLYSYRSASMGFIFAALFAGR